MKMVSHILRHISQTLHVQLSAIFNHAVKFYDLKNNPICKVAGGMGSKKGGNMMFWTQDEYKEVYKLCNG